MEHCGGSGENKGQPPRPRVHSGITKGTKYGRQNPISSRWNSEEQLILWRAAWADTSNALIRTLKATIAKLKKAVETTIPAIAAAMEPIRQNIIVFNYGLLLVRDRRKDTKEYVGQATRKYADYKNVRSQMKVKAKERGELQKELAGLSVFAAGRRKELKAKIEELSEEIEELQFEVNPLCGPLPRQTLPG